MNADILLRFPAVKKSLLKILLALAFICRSFVVSAQQTTPGFTVTVVNERSHPIAGATVQAHQGDKLVKASVTDTTGVTVFYNLPAGRYIFSVSGSGYKPQTTAAFEIPGANSATTVIMQPSTTSLSEVTITGRKALIEQKQGKVVINVDASITNSGATVLEVLEKSPGVTVDRNGTISLQGKTGVLVLVDDKPTYLSGADLNSLLSSMNSSQVDQIELMPIPPARYEANGNAGVINIKTKKSRARGFNGTLSLTGGQGHYPKTVDNLSLNWRTGKFNTFFNYNITALKTYVQLTALRKYYDDSGALLSMLDQSSFFGRNILNNTIKTGTDYYLTPKTTFGIVLTGTLTGRLGDNVATAHWLEPGGVLDSTIATNNRDNNQFKNGAINFNIRQNISSNQNITADFDALRYNITDKQDFDNQLLAAGGYDEVTKANIPTAINITSFKADYTLEAGKAGTIRAGFKSSHSATDNSADYENLESGTFVNDSTKSNRFIYSENINAVYGEWGGKQGKLSYQGGLRYEHTGYYAHQLGNAVDPDTSFSRNYGGFFPSGYLTYQADTANGFTLSIGRRIDRPAFQVLNPFIFVINKYTYETGNSNILPQNSWNLSLSHQYKDLFTTTVSYSVIDNYFSQLFLADTTKGILFYSQGNVGHVYNFGLTESVSASPFNWWNFTAAATFNHKHFAGFNGNDYTSLINQLNLNTSSQFMFAKIYTAELSGAYTTHARNDIQELLYPTGQVSLGISRSIFNKKGTLRISYRDVFHTNWMEGLTQFPNATEYFKERYDTRVFSIAFRYRFGQAYKAERHTSTGASDEAERAGSGN
ncbi:MAG: TonB-dependent receptor [Bacteroidetes bacterium]|nr:TonB-dependent receptor [Bacteroidota bacterium]